VKNDLGSAESTIWLVGDSQPVRWREKLDQPLDPRHPTRHSIWTPIENHIQESVFASSKSRVNVGTFFLSNAIDDPGFKPKRQEDWDKLSSRIDFFRGLIADHRPRMILTFGSFAFELLRRARTEAPRSVAYWTCDRLGEDFRRGAAAWKNDSPNLLPLLHATIARGRFLDAHRLFCGCGQTNPNYFSYVGHALANILSTEFRDMPIWC